MVSCLVEKPSLTSSWRTAHHPKYTWTWGTFSSCSSEVFELGMLVGQVDILVGSQEPGGDNQWVRSIMRSPYFLKRNLTLARAMCNKNLWNPKDLARLLTKEMCCLYGSDFAKQIRTTSSIPSDLSFFLLPGVSLLRHVMEGVGGHKLHSLQ